MCVAHFWRKSRTKRSFWRLARLTFGGSLVRNNPFRDLHSSLLEEVSYETRSFWRLVRPAFGGSLVQNAHFCYIANVAFEALPKEVCSKMIRETGVRLRSRRVFCSSSVFQNDLCSKMIRFWVAHITSLPLHMGWL